ncbi:hypothetical protein X777_07816 [Ooceraea biroi]|uniref:Uncharacterized protein n=1 Tax=Ooceraea biroi TaxID=2015173 RepID=A0A026X063_OOCBI|nr:hypothetical protein X777_07816 [Ooceraea biroi]
MSPLSVHHRSQLIDLKFHVAGVATVSLGSVEAGAWGGEVSCGLALVPVVAAEAEAAAAVQAEGEEVGPGEAGGSRDFVWWRRDLHYHPHLHLPLSRSLINFSLPYGGGKLESVRHRPPEELSTA